MTFDEFKETYFDGDEQKAIECCVCEGYYGDYKLSKSIEGFKTILNSMTREQADKYLKCLRAEMRMFHQKNKKHMNEIIELRAFKVPEKSESEANGQSEAEKQTVDKARCEKHIRKKLRDNYAVVFLIVFIAAVYLPISLCVDGAFIFGICLAVFSVAAGVGLFFYQFNKNKKTFEKILQKAEILKLPLLEKDYVPGGSEGTWYNYLKFWHTDKYGVLKEDVERKEFKSAKIGDFYYLLVAQVKKKTKSKYEVFAVFNTKKYDICNELSDTVVTASFDECKESLIKAKNAGRIK